METDIANMSTLPFNESEEEGPITRSEMQMILGPLQSCLQRMEGMLQEIKGESTSAGGAENSKFVASASPASAQAKIASNVQQVELEETKLATQLFPPVATLPAVPEQETPKDEFQGTSEFQQQESSPSARSEPTEKATPVSDGTKVAAPAAQPPVSCYRDIGEETGNHLIAHMKINAELRGCHVMEGLGENEKMFVRVVQALDVMSTYWYSIEEPKRHSWMSRFSSSRKFELLSISAIMFNSVLVAWVSDWQMQHVGEVPPFSATVIEGVCLAFFVFELILRFGAHRCYFFINSEMHWNIFDFILVSISLVNFILDLTIGTDSNSNVGFMRLLRLGKLARIFRSLRSLRFFKSLVLLCESLIKSFISLFWGFIMLCFVLYLFGLVFMQALLECLSAERDLDPIKQKEILDSFGSLANTIVSLYMAVTGGDDWGKFYHILSCSGWFYSWVFVAYTFVLYFALFNIVTGMLVEKAMTSHEPDKAALVLSQRRLFSEQKARFLAIFEAMDEDNSGMISRAEFMQCMSNPSVLAYMASIDVAVDDVEFFFDTVAQSKKHKDGSSEDLEVPIGAFVEGCMHMKGTATAIDMQKQLYETHLLHKDLRRFQAVFRDSFRHVERLIGQSHHAPEQMPGTEVSEITVHSRWKL